MAAEVVSIRTARGAGRRVGGISTMSDGVSHNLNGQRLGRKGRDTRERIIAVATQILSEDPEDGQLTLTEVARRSELRMGTLYIYFADLTELILAVLEPVMATAEDAFVHVLRDHWPDEALGERAAAFVGSYYAFWQRHTRILHLRNTLADHGDDRLMLHRVRSALPVMRLIASQMGSQPTSHGNSMSSTATALMTGLERVATVMSENKVPRLLDEPVNPINLLLQAEARLFELAIRDQREQAQRGG